MIKLTNDSVYQKTIIHLINGATNKGSFIFKANDESGPVIALRKATSSVPSIPGLYFAFCKDDKLMNEHTFTIEEISYTLLYFGKAGQKKNGQITKQKLNERLNNVISNSSRKLKDVKRGVYWNIILNELNKEELFVIWVGTNENCVTHETMIYDALKNGNHIFPILNKKLGRVKNQK
jgi:hypothetical protein